MSYLSDIVDAVWTYADRTLDGQAEVASDGTWLDDVGYATWTAETRRLHRTTAYVDSVLADTPVAYWRLNETSGTTVADSSGNGHNGTATGVTFGQAGPTNDVDGGAGDFDNDFVSVSHHNDLQPEEMSVECWVSLDTLAPPSSRFPNIVGKRVPGSVGPWYLRLDPPGTNPNNANLSFAQSRSGGSIIAAGTLTSGWHHVVGTLDSSLVARLYIDGVLVATSSTGSGTLNTNTDDVLIGVARPAQNEFIDGRIAEVAIYDTALSSERIAAHYAAASISTQPHIDTILALTPTALWPLNDADSQITDISGNLNHGTYYNNPTQQQPPLTNDPSEYSVFFQGEGQYGEIGIDFDLSGDFALGFLFKGEGSTVFLAAIGAQFLVFGINENNQFAILTELETIVTSTKSVADGDAHYAIIIREDDTLKLYLDGALEATGDASILTSPFSVISLAGTNFSSTAVTLDDLWYIKGRSISEEQVQNLAIAAGVAEPVDVITISIDHQGFPSEGTIETSTLVSASVDHEGYPSSGDVSSSVIVTGSINHPGYPSSGQVIVDDITVISIDHQGYPSEGEIVSSVQVSASIDHVGSISEGSVESSVFVTGAIDHSGYESEGTVEASTRVSATVSYEGRSSEGSIDVNVYITATVSHEGYPSEGEGLAGDFKLTSINHPGYPSKGEVLVRIYPDVTVPSSIVKSDLTVWTHDMSYPVGHNKGVFIDDQTVDSRSLDFRSYRLVPKILQNLDK